MLDHLVSKIDEVLTPVGIITDVILRTDRSILEGEESHEIEIGLIQDETIGQTTFATIHLYPLEETNQCEVEVEVTYPVGNRSMTSFMSLVEEIVPVSAVTEKIRRLTGKPEAMETYWIVDFNFIVNADQIETIEDNLFADMADKINRLIRL
ncbi:hypothetical protein [Brevibacillus daliensis]|uniref:hypothetical protein n=1 Tax=Brevibacillus daliensis TaxID=2892995 RepID=UPI001E62A601|nr:hypothetical protein [Brevibacillus daliensis]